MPDMQTVNGPIWNMVKAANPGASEAEIWKKTDAVLKANGISWDSARRNQKADGSPIPKQIDMQAATGKNTSSVQPKSSTGQSSSLESLIMQLAEAQVKDARSPGGLDAFLSGKGVNRNNSRSLAARGGNFVYSISGQQFNTHANPELVLGNGFMA
jgi:hypothetical protein